MSSRPGAQSTATKVLSAQRLTTLVSSLIVALASGTNYVYSAYAPQLGARLRISHTKLNVIALAGNVGVYSSGPILGKLVDRKGPRLLLATAFVFLLVGYSGIRHFYDVYDTAALRRDDDDEKLSMISLCVLVACSFLTGAGGNGGLTSSMNATAKSFPDQMRASTTGLVISGFGLSAFLFSTIAHLLFPGDTSSFLLLLALGTSLPMIFGFFLIRPIPLPEATATNRPHERHSNASYSELPHDGFAHAAGVDNVFSPDTIVYEHHPHNDSRANLLDGSTQTHERSHSLEMAVSPPPTERRHRSLSGPGRSRVRHSRIIEVMQELYGKALWMSSDFWLLFVLLSLLSGTGLMYINNVGSISQALYAKGKPEFDEVESGKWQSMQVSVISIANCLGRILIGLTADLVKNNSHSPRSYCICLVAVVFILSQVIAIQVEDVEGLWYASALLGFAYGGTFGLFPTMTIEWFGLSHFSENWGYVSLSPMLGGNLFSLAFGRNLDNHAAPSTEPSPDNILSRAGLPSEHQCFDGRSCYSSSLYLTIFACTVAFLLSLYAAWKDRRRMTCVDGMKVGDLSDVIWDEGEEA